MRRIINEKRKKLLALVLSILMLFSAAPMSCFSGLGSADSMSMTASAYGASNYCATAAAQWAKDHYPDYNSVLLGTGYWNNGGDCANFVSQCLYMGGMDMSGYWNTNGYLGHWSEPYGYEYAGSYVRCQQLYNFLTKQMGGQSFKNPAASQVSIGDVLIFYKPELGRMGHAAIVVDIINGVPVIAYHSTGTTYGYTTNWHLNFSGNNTYLIKLYGTLCVNYKPRSIDVYTAGSGDLCLYRNSSASSGYSTKFLSGEYAHVSKTVQSGGYTWGYTFRYGNWGWIKLSSFNYRGHYQSAPVNHIMGNWYVKSPGDCRHDGVRQRDCQRCDYFETQPIKGNHITDPSATCLTQGYCKICGTVTENALGHDWDTGTITTEPTCTEKGVRTFVCRRDALHTYTEEVEELGHYYEAGATAPTCTSDGIKTYQCVRCDDSYTEYIDEENRWSDWTAEKIDNLLAMPGKYETSIQYRYRDKTFTDSYETSLSGWTQYGSDWIQSGSNSIYYMYETPTDSEGRCDYRGPYAGNSPYYNSETSTTKRVVTDVWSSYIYYHWCRNNNRGTTEAALKYGEVWAAPKGECQTFHWFEEQAYSHNTEMGPTVHIYVHTALCKASCNWYIGSVHRSSYTDYKKLFHYYKWGEWSQWGMDKINSTADRQVETRVVYKYDLAALGHDFSVDGGNNFVQTGKYLNDDELDSVCFTNAKNCSRCGVRPPNVSEVKHSFPDFETERDQYTIVSANDMTTVYRAECRNGCKCYTTKTLDNHKFVPDEVVPPSCCGENGTEGYTLYRCVNHPEETYKDDFTEALADDYSHGIWEITETPTCTLPGKKISKCSRFDDCGHYITEEIPALGHTLTKHEATPVTCTVNGNSEYYSCSNCGRAFSDSKAENEIENDSWIIPATGHCGTDNSGNELWVTELEAGCDVTGWQRLYCVNDWCDENSDCDMHKDGHGYIIDEREIPAIPANYYVYDTADAVYEGSGDPETDFEGWVSTTCERTGLLYVTCRNCENTEKRHGFVLGDAYSVIDLTPKDHIPGEWVTDENAYCIYDGFRHRNCERCSIVLDEEIIPAPCDVHHFENKQEAEGCIYQECRCCGLIEGGNHNFERDPARDVSPTCTVEGNEAYTCSICAKHNDKPIPALGHDCTEVSRTPATCIEGEKIKFECQRSGCNYSYLTEDINPDLTAHDWGSITYTWSEDNLSCTALKPCNRAHQHDIKETVTASIATKDPKCLENGSNTYTAVFENGEFEKQVKIIDIAALGHNWGDWTQVTPSDCTNKGLEKRVCKRDESHVDERETAIDPNAHNWDDGVIDPTSDCSNHGIKTFTCKINPIHIRTEEMDLDPDAHDWGEITYTWSGDNKTCTALKPCNRDHSHDIIETVAAASMTVNPTCLEKGSTTYTATFINSEFAKQTNVVEINALGHDWGEITYTWSGDNKTCTALKPCNRDHAHDIAETVTASKVTADPTCLEKGSTTYTATFTSSDFAKQAKVVEINALGHDWDEGVITTEPTCKDEGVKTYTCKNDSKHTYTESVAVDPDNHVGGTYVKDAKDPTCTENGYTGDTYCADCNALLEKGKDKPAHGHNYVLKASQAPTYDAAGYKYYECTYDASHNYKEDIPSLVSYKANFVVPTDKVTMDVLINNGYENVMTVTLDGTEYYVIKSVRFGKDATVLNSSEIPTVPSIGDIYTATWEDYTLNNADLYIKAVYTLKSSDNESELIGDKKVQYENGTATVTLSAFAETLNAKVKYGAEPYDIVLVLDVSDSMKKEENKIGDKTRLEVLQDSATKFINLVYESAVENNVDHNIAMIKFNKNSYILTGSKTADNAFVSVKHNKDVLNNEIAALTVAQWTRSDLAMQNARDILAAKKEADEKNNVERKKLVIFFTDGEPTDGTNYNDSAHNGINTYFSYPVANVAIGFANEIKNMYDTPIYCVGVASGVDIEYELNKKVTNNNEVLNTFIQLVSSNYMQSTGMSEVSNFGERTSNDYYLGAKGTNAEDVDTIFKDIFAQKISNNITFSNITFFDKISEYFTLTTQQEEALRNELYRQYGVTNENIIVTRNADGTTDIVIKSVNPKLMTKNNVEGYGVTISYEVSANQNAIDAGLYKATTDDNPGGIAKDDGVTVYKFVPEDSGIQISTGRAMIEYVVDGQTYAIKEAGIGDTITPVDGENLSWQIGNNDVVTQNYTRIEAEFADETRTITYIVGGSETTHTYHVGEIITVPEITAPEGKIFVGWDTVIPFRMGNSNITATARFVDHAHEWTATGSTGSCTEGISTTYTCFCGKTKSETASPCDHSYEASYALVDGNNTARIICTTCGYVYQDQTVIDYKIKDTVIDMTMLQNAETSVQPDGTITIKLAIPDNLKNSKNLKVYRVENNKKTEVPSVKEGNFLVVTLDHFSYYVISTETNGSDVPAYEQIVCTFEGHKYTESVVKPTCMADGFTTHTCSVCGDSYTDSIVDATGHTDGNSDGYCDTCGADTGDHKPDDPSKDCVHACHRGGFIGFIWKIACFILRIFGVNKYKYCTCGYPHW